MRIEQCFNILTTLLETNAFPCNILLCLYWKKKMFVATEVARTMMYAKACMNLYDINLWCLRFCWLCHNRGSEVIMVGYDMLKICCSCIKIVGFKYIPFNQYFIYCQKSGTKVSSISSANIWSLNLPASISFHEELFWAKCIFLSPSGL